MPVKATAGDVARAARVSTATVSRALNRPDTVSPLLRKKVLAEADRLGYVPSGPARTLALNRSFTIGAVIPTLNNAIFAASIAAFEQRLSLDGYTLLLTVSGYDLESETRQVRTLAERGVDGVMLVGALHNERTWQLIEQSGRAALAIWSDRVDAPVPCIGFDNAAPASQAVDHLVGLGHRRIAMIAGVTKGNDRAQQRVKGVKRALKRHGLPADGDIIVEKPYSHADGRQGLKELLAQTCPPSAVVCGNDVLAMGAMFEAYARGLTVPRDLSVIGYDNLPITSHLTPSLTTVDVPSSRLGEAAAAALTNFLIHGQPIRSRTFDAPFLERATTGPPA